MALYKNLYNAFAVNIVCCVLVHILWGLQPTACRYLLVFAPTAYNGQAVIAFARVVSLLSIASIDAISDFACPPLAGGNVKAQTKAAQSMMDGWKNPFKHLSKGEWVWVIDIGLVPTPPLFPTSLTQPPHTHTQPKPA